MLSSRLLKHIGRHNRFYMRTEPFFRWLASSFQKSLDAVLRKKWIAAALIGLARFSSPFSEAACRASCPHRGQERGAHRRDRARGHVLEPMDRIMTGLVEDVIRQVPERESMTS